MEDAGSSSVAVDWFASGRSNAVSLSGSSALHAVEREVYHSMCSRMIETSFWGLSTKFEIPLHEGYWLLGSGSPILPWKPPATCITRVDRPAEWSRTFQT
eukprot:gb/GECG01008142.1/.p1 GENE.gb/GECG01008142.1/~~gb/GECG01008142.1/.p1  ORF type:complete len:100 (+),score=3.93 gb/GECG01008142.1/:1-300(+)